MIQARVNVFETNSSSTHNCTIMSDKDYQAFVNGDIYINSGIVCSKSKFNDNDYVTKEQIVDIYEKVENEYYHKHAKDLKCYINNDDSSFDDYLCDNGLTYQFMPYSYFGDNLKEDEHTFTTEHGDVVHVLCAYGFDG